MTPTSLPDQYFTAREHTELICRPLKTEDYVVQPIVDVSPPKWHLGHTTWFFETMVLKPFVKKYQEFHPDYNFVFNSYYESVGSRVVRTDRGNLSRPTVDDIYRYRKHVDAAMGELLSSNVNDQVRNIVILGLNHEQQHQELLFSDIKYILGHNPLMPAYDDKGIEEVSMEVFANWLKIDEGLYNIGFDGGGFCFDNELERHRVYLKPYHVASELVKNKDYLEFIDAGGYQNFQYWHSEGWEWVKANNIRAPLYWHFINRDWRYYTLAGLKKVDLNQPVTHVSFYEASAFAAWKRCRLPTEAEWEVAATAFNWGKRWEWTNSGYLPYPGFKKAEGALGEYNGKFMINQMALRGSSVATTKGHSRITYRNFFHPFLQWQYTGIRLAQ